MIVLQINDKQTINGSDIKLVREKNSREHKQQQSRNKRKVEKQH